MLVATAEIERAVTKVMALARATMPKVGSSPALPITQPARRYMMTPRMVRIEGVKTPMKAPSFLRSAAVSVVEVTGFD